MEHIALYRQYRPLNFDQIVEQQHAVSALRQSVLSGQIAHAYLFSGTRGTGKTSVAKIFSRAINCLSPQDGNPCNQCEICRGILNGALLDVIEMDAASNNSVDNIRRICDEVLFMPSQAKYKVYIIDEVHMLSAGAFNALLKTLEEPPAHAVFILATTEPHRIPATIISRCQRYDFRRIPLESIIERLRAIANDRKISIEDTALQAIANLSDGALRDAISLLDQVSFDSSHSITRDDILKMTGVVDDAFLFSMARAILTADSGEMLMLCEKMIMDGRDIVRFTLDLAHYFRDLLVLSVSFAPENLVRASSESLSEMQKLSSSVTTNTLLTIVSKLSGLVSELKWSPDMRTSFEISLLSIAACQIQNDASSGMKTKTENRIPSPKNAPNSDRNNPVSGQITPSTASPVKVAPPISAADAADTYSMSSFTPNLTRAAEAKPPDKSHVTNLSKVTSVASVRSADIPLPPSIPDEGMIPPPETTFPEEKPASPDSSGHGKADHLSDSLTSLWKILLKRWEDTMFSDVLQLRLARVTQSEDTFCVIFPDTMHPFISQLTARNEYKRIREDILNTINDTKEVALYTEESFLQKDSKADSSDLVSSPSQPEWIQQMIAFSNHSGIPVETVDDM